MEHANDSIELVPAKSEAAGRDKTDYEKLLIYCPAIASDTLLYYIRQGDSYSLRSYGGRLGVNATGMHAPGAHMATDFERVYRPDRWREMSHLELAVDKKTRWQKIVADEWNDYQAKRLG